MLTLELAREELRGMTDADNEPAISEELLDRMLAKTAYAAEHAVETAYRIGDRVVAAGTAYNGRYYLCIEGGTSWESAPTWPKGRSAFLGQTVRDGDELIWEDCGPAYSELYNLQAAEHECWNWKAAQTARKIPLADKDMKVDLEKRWQHFLAQAALCTPAYVE